MRLFLVKPARYLMIVLMGVSASAIAAGTAVIETGSAASTSRTTIEYNDENQLRMNMSGQAASYMVFRESKVYVVTQQEGAQPVVMDLGSMMKMLGSAFGESMKGFQASPENMETFVSLKDTGENETIAGIRGDVHTLRYRDGDGKERSEIVVLTDNRKVREMTEMMGEMGKHMAHALGSDTGLTGEDFYNSLYAQKSGILRVGNDFRLAEIDGRAPASSRFELPATPTAIPDFGGIFSGQAAQQSRSQVSGGTSENSTGAENNGLDDVLSNKADRQKTRVDNKVDDAVDDATDETVDKVLDKVFDRIFGK